MNLKDKIEGKIKKIKNISFFDTEGNNAIWKAFILFCSEESDNNYLMGLKILLQSYSTDWKYASLYTGITELRQELAQLKNEKKKESPSKNRSIKTFGGKE